MCITFSLQGHQRSTTVLLASSLPASVSRWRYGHPIDLSSMMALWTGRKKSSANQLTTVYLHRVSFLSWEKPPSRPQRVSFPNCERPPSQPHRVTSQSCERPPSQPHRVSSLSDRIRNAERPTAQKQRAHIIQALPFFSAINLLLQLPFSFLSFPLQVCPATCRILCSMLCSCAICA